MRFPSNAITTACNVTVSVVVKRPVLRLLNKFPRKESKSFLFLFKKRLFVELLNPLNCCTAEMLGDISSVRATL